LKRGGLGGGGGHKCQRGGRPKRHDERSHFLLLKCLLNSASQMRSHFLLFSFYNNIGTPTDLFGVGAEHFPQKKPQINQPSPGTHAIPSAEDRAAWRRRRRRVEEGMGRDDEEAGSGEHVRLCGPHHKYDEEGEVCGAACGHRWKQSEREGTPARRLLLPHRGAQGLPLPAPRSSGRSASPTSSAYVLRAPPFSGCPPFDSSFAIFDPAAAR
jgi:hypothetical protein